MRFRPKLIPCLLLLSILLIEAPGFSSEKNQSSALMDFLGKSLNFIILFGGLAFVLAKPIKNFLRELILSVEKTITETERDRKKAEKELARVQGELEGLAAEVQKIKQEGEAAGLIEKERILAIARKEAERVTSLARQEIERHTQAAKRRLREHAADLAISMAKSKIRKRMTDDLHRRIIERSIQGLEKLYEDARPG